MKNNLLFNICPDSEFFGRVNEIEYIYKRAAEAGRPAPNIFLSGRRWTGKTEILRRVYQRLFWGQARVAPVYFQFKKYGSTDSFAEDFLKEVIKQYIAFRRREPGLVRAEVSLEKLERILIDNDDFDLAELISRHRESKRSEDHTAALRNAIGVPHLIAIRSGIPLYLILDDFDLSGTMPVYGEGSGIIKEFMEALSSGSYSFLAAASTRNALEGGALSGSVEAITLEGLDEELSVSMMMDLCRQYNIESDSDILSVAAIKLEGNPMYIKSIIWAANRSERRLVELKDFADLYTQELINGNIGLSIRSSVRIKGLNDLRVLNSCAARETSEDELAERFRYSHGDLKGILDELSSLGVIETSLGSVKWTGDGVIKDFINFVYETRVKGRSAEEVRISIIHECLKEGFNRRGAKVAGRLKEDVAGMLKSFNNQKTLKVLFRNQAFTARFKNGAYRPEDRKGEDEIILPQMIGSFDTTRLEKNESGPPILIARGFQNGRYDGGNEVIWITGIKDALSPVNLGDAENYIRRSAILRENFRATKVVRWLIGKEGFTGEAQKRLEAEGIYSSDMAQLKIIRESIENRGAAERLKSSSRIMPNKEFEVVLPASVKAELVAAKAAEEIGTEMGFDDSAIGQIKAALVEACINAFEHSKLKDSRVFLKFIASNDRLTIHVRNGGVGYDKQIINENPARTDEGLPQKRGWGLELMKGLMDEVRFEKLKDGTQVVLVKYLIKKGDAGDKEAKEF